MIAIARRRYGSNNKANWLKVIPEANNATITVTIASEVPAATFEYIEYSTNNGTTWTRTNNADNTVVTVTVPNVSSGQKVYFRGKGTATGCCVNSTLKGTNIKCSSTFSVAGDVKSLLYLNSLTNKSIGDYGLALLFYGSTTLRSASELDISATELGEYAYAYMFSGCTNLTEPPVLPSVAGNYAFYYMFRSCTSLVTPPALQMNTLRKGCCIGMFNNCTSLTSTPTFKKVSNYDSCYKEMFKGCTALTTASLLPATTGSPYCYRGMFYDCTSLQRAPEIKLTTFGGTSCCNEMFYNCSSLNYIKAMFTTTPSNTYTNDWVNGVASSGTFVKNSKATWNVTGTNGIPSGWTVQTASS